MRADDKVIKIGALLPMSGPGSYFGAQDKQGIELALEQINRVGIGGYKLEVKYEDSSCSPLPATQAAKRLLEQYRPDVVIGEECFPVMTMKDAIPDIPSKRVRALEEEARDHPPSREDVAKAQASMDVLGPRYADAFRQQNIVAIAHPTMPIPAPPLPIDGDALPSPFEINGRQYPDTAILRNSLPGPAFRAPGLSIPAGITPDGLPAGLEIDGLPGQDDHLLSLGMAIEAVLGPLPSPTFRNG